MYKRFFAFGCSYTRYCWPTWADIVGRDLFRNYGTPYYNFGLAGLGNVGIFSNLVYAKHMYNITDDDLVIVVWSSWNRHDELGHDGNWKGGGSVLNSPVFDEQYINEHWCLADDVIKNITSILAANSVCNIKFNGSMQLFESPHARLDNNRDAYDLMNMFLRMYPNNQFVHDYNLSNWRHIDGHPEVHHAVDYVNNYVYKNINLQLSDETLSWANEWDNMMINLSNQIDAPNAATSAKDSAKKLVSLRHRYDRNNYCTEVNLSIDAIAEYLQYFMQQSI